MSHTATPWEVDGSTIFGADDFEIGEAYNVPTPPVGSYIPDSLAAANAAHIVHCVNAHDRLVDSLRSAIRWLRRIEQEHPGCLNDDAIEKHLKPALDGEPTN